MLPPKIPALFTRREWSNVDLIPLFPDFFTVWCVLIFLGPCVKSAYYMHDINVVYWVGMLPAFLSSLAVPLIVIGAAIHWLIQKPSKLAIVISMVGGGLALALTSDQLVVNSSDLRNIFVASDCRWSEQKYELEKAWEVAFVFFEDCQSAATNRTMSYHTIDKCPGYSAMLTKYSKSWGYLSRLEEAYTCAGWCSPSTPLWNPGGEIWDPCSAVVAEILSTKVIPFATQVTVFGMTATALTVVFLVHMGETMRHVGVRW